MSLEVETGAEGRAPGNQVLQFLEELVLFSDYQDVPQEIHVKRGVAKKIRP
jgi:hypothetical protein